MCRNCIKKQAEFWKMKRNEMIEQIDCWEHRLRGRKECDKLGKEVRKKFRKFCLSVGNKEIVEVMDDWDCDEINKQIHIGKSYKHRFTMYSKFYIYSFNNDWKNAKKYHDKLTEDELERMEEYKETGKEVEIWKYNSNDMDDVEEVGEVISWKKK